MEGDNCGAGWRQRDRGRSCGGTPSVSAGGADSSLGEGAWGVRLPRQQHFRRNGPPRAAAPTGCSIDRAPCRGRALSRPVYRKLGTPGGRKGTEPLPYKSLPL